MPATSKAAVRDAILAHLKTAWDAQTPPVPPLLYEDRKQDTPEDGTSWARVTVRHVTGNQRTMAEAPNRRFEKPGFVAVEIYTPLGNGQVLADQYSDVVEAALEGAKTSDGVVWFRNVRAQEVGANGEWYQTNVLADFTYDRVR